MNCDQNRISDQIDGGLNQQKEDRQRLIDHFAGLAMQGVIIYHGQNAGTYDSLGRISYDIAEAMLDERERRMKDVV